MKKKFLLGVMCLTAMLTSCLSLSACGKDKECTHTFGDWTVTETATCTTAGSRKHTCTKCDKEVSEVVEALGHDWSDASYVWSAENVSCTANSSCERDGCDETALETKNSTNSITTPASCTAKGVKTFVVSFESDAFEDQSTNVDVDKLGHSLDVRYTFSADYITCEADQYCTRDNCDQIETAIATATPVVTLKATCEDDGNTQYVYEFADAIFETQTQTQNVPITKLGHDFGGAVGYTWSNGYTTCTAKRDCLRVGCSEYESETLQNLQFTTTLEPTCVDFGKKQTVATFVTNELFLPQTSPFVNINPTGHNIQLDTNSCVAKTCTVNGKDVYKCQNSNCTYTETETLLATHSWDHDEITCSQGRSCSICDATEPALGHYFRNPVVVEATCTEDGSSTYRCIRCSHVEVETEAKLGHELDLNNPHEEPIANSCDVQIYYDCLNQDCAGHVNGSIKSYHTYTASITLHPTCVAIGTKHYDCVNCEHSYDETIAIDENAHNWIEDAQAGHTHKCSNTGCEAVKSVIGSGTTEHTFTENTGDNTEVQFPDASIMIDDLTNYEASGDVKLSASTLDPTEKESALTNVEQSVKDAIGDKPIYDFGMTNSNGDSLLVAGGGNLVVVKIPYTLGADEDPDGILIWYIADDGQVSSYTAKYNQEGTTGYVTFETDHFSRYAVSVVSPAEVCEIYNHNYRIDGARTTYATCYQEGHIVEICQRCGAERVTTEGKYQHFYDDGVTVPETCTVAGSTTYTCQNTGCEQTYVVKIMPTGHNFEMSSGTEATCANEGNVIYVCTNADCSESYKLISGKLPHTYSKTVVEATCEEGGYTEYVCSKCQTGTEGHSYRDNIVEELGHNNVSVYYPHTSNTVAGYTVEYCDRCQIEEDGEVTTDASIIHDWNIEEATCIEAKYCLICSHVAEDIDEVDGHNMVEGICTRCGDGCEHTWANDTITVDPTCTETGYVAQVCSECGFENVTETIEALGHAGDIYCLRCGHSEIDIDNLFEANIDYMLGGEYSIYIDRLNILSELTNEQFGINVSLAEVYALLEDDGNFYAQGCMEFTLAESYDGFNVSGESSARFVIKNGVVYVETTQPSIMTYREYGELFATSATIKYGDRNYSILDLNDKVIFDGFTVGDLLATFGEKVLPEIKSFVNTASNKQIIAELIKMFANDLFEAENVDGEYKLVLSSDQLLRLNEDFYNLSIVELIDSRFGSLINSALSKEEGSAVENFVETLKDIAFNSETTIADVLTYFKLRGIDIEELAIMVDTLMGGQFGINSEFFAEIADLTLTNLILMYAGGSNPGLQPVADPIQGPINPIQAIEAKIDEVVAMLSEMTIYDVVEMLSTDEITGQPALTTENVYEMVASYSEIISQMINLEFVLNSDGVIKMMNTSLVIPMEEILIQVEYGIGFSDTYQSQVDYVSFVNKINNEIAKIKITEAELAKFDIFEECGIDPECFAYDTTTGALTNVTFVDDSDPTNPLSIVWDFAKASYSVDETCRNKITVTLNVPMVMTMGEETIYDTDEFRMVYNPTTRGIFMVEWEYFEFRQSFENDLSGHTNIVEISRGEEPEDCTGVQEVVYYCRDCQKTVTVYTKPDHTYEHVVICDGESCEDGASVTYICTLCGLSETDTINAGEENYGRHLAYNIYKSQNGLITITTCACDEEFYIYSQNGYQYEPTDGTDYDEIYKYVDGTTTIMEYITYVIGQYDCERIEIHYIVVKENEITVLEKSITKTIHMAEVDYSHYVFDDERVCGQNGVDVHEICQICGRVETYRIGCADGDHVYGYARYECETSLDFVQFSFYFCPCGGNEVTYDVNYGSAHEQETYLVSDTTPFYITVYEVNGYGLVAVREGTYEIQEGGITYVMIDVYMSVNIITGDSVEVELEDKQSYVLYSYEVSHALAV